MSGIYMLHLGFIPEDDLPAVDAHPHLFRHDVLLGLRCHIVQVVTIQ